MNSICVFCGSSGGNKDIFRHQSKKLGKIMASRKIRLIYGGASVGLMGEIADAVLENGGEAIGVIPSFFSKKEIAHKSLTELIYVDSMHERKLKMAELSDAFIALPGGFGTLDEYFEMLTWSQLDLHRKPVGLLNIDGYWNKLFELFEDMTRNGFVRPAHHSMILIDDNPLNLIGKLEAYKPVDQEKWIQRIKS